MLLQWSAAGLALLAALLWLWSSRIRLPKAIERIDYGSVSPVEPKSIDDLDRLTNGLERQGQLSALAADTAAVSAALQVLALLTPP